jgi:hypothetical protein
MRIKETFVVSSPMGSEEKVEVLYQRASELEEAALRTLSISVTNQLIAFGNILNAVFSADGSPGAGQVEGSGARAGSVGMVDVFPALSIPTSTSMSLSESSSCGNRAEPGSLRDGSVEAG